MPLFYAPVFIPAFLVVVLEMTEVVALVFALSAGGPSLRTTIVGALSGVALVGGIGLVAGAALDRLPSIWLLGPSAIVLAGFGVFLFRGTVRAYRRARSPNSGSSAPPKDAHPVVQFGGGFSVGAIEATEAVIVLVALAAPGYGLTTLVGAVVAGIVLVALALVLHGQIRRIKVPLLRLGAASLLFTFAIFWGGEALGVPWPGQDLVLLPLFAGVLLTVRAAVGAVLGPTLPVETKS